VLTRALKPSKKFSSGSSGLSLAKKASVANVRMHGGKKSLPWMSVSGAGTTSKVLDLFGYASSTSEDEAAAPAPTPRWNHLWKSPLKTSRKPSDVPSVKGTSIPSCSIPFIFVFAIFDFCSFGRQLSTGKCFY
jgi:hypothetical protein